MTLTPRFTDTLFRIISFFLLLVALYRASKKESKNCRPSLDSRHKNSRSSQNFFVSGARFGTSLTPRTKKKTYLILVHTTSFHCF